MSRVSVIIPVYNHARFLPEAIESALAQTLSPHEIIVVDDGSTDDTPSVAARYSGRIRSLWHPNQGVAASRNAGAALSTGDQLAFLDADDVWLPQKLEHQLDRLLGKPAVGLVHCGVEDIDQSGNSLRTLLCGLEQDVTLEMLLFRRPVILGGGSGVMIPRQVFETVGGFDTQLSTSADWDLYFRIARHYEVAFIDEVLVQYRRHGSNMHSNIGAMERDMLHAYSKIFRDSPEDLRRIKRKAYGSLYAALAGSYYSTKNWGQLGRSTLLSVIHSPDVICRFLGWPVRRMLRRPTNV